MTVISVKLEHSEGSEDADDVSYTLRYLVRSDDRYDGPLTIRNAAGWNYGDPYVNGNDSDPRAVAVEINETPVSDGHYTDWNVEVQFKSIDTNLDLSNPLNDPVSEEVSWRPVRKQVFVDGAGNWITNTAGDAYPGGLEGDDSVPSVSYSLNQASFPFALAQANRNAVNSVPWKGFAANTVRVGSITSRRMYHRTIGVYYNVTYEFLVNSDTWDQQAPSYGYNEITGTAPNRKKSPIYGPHKRLITSPWPLDENGKAIEYDTETGYASLPHMRQFEIYPKADFNSLFSFL